MDQEVGGSSPPSCTSKINNLFDYNRLVASQVWALGSTWEAKLFGNLHEAGRLALRGRIIEGRCRMAQQNDNPDRDFSAGYEVLKYVPEYSYRDLFEDPVIRDRVGELIAWAVDPTVNHR